ncbi:hypothetical protein ACO2Q8_16750 [Larkinella sp. VNQ87]|uniref:hypothetical protein n=1 Tax=Larkinella sp. VNQ87 TaxID=3400921 RepID=UPI003C101385
MLLFSVETIRPLSKLSALEAHLVDVAQRWAKGEGVMKPVSLKAFLLLLKNELKWYTRDHKASPHVSIRLANDGREVQILTADTTELTARIRARR